MLDLVVAPQASCQGWKIRLDAELGGATASPLLALGATAPPATAAAPPKDAPPAPAPK